MNILLCLLLGYLFGNINPAYIISRLRGFDIREKGTGNAGASNVMMTMGKKAGLFTALFDIFKAAAASLIAYYLFPQLGFAKILSGCMCIIGHIFPVIMKFRGGKGLACLAGTLLAFDPKLFALILFFELCIGLLFDYICLIPLSGSVLFTMIYALITGDPIGTSVLSAITVIVFFKHIQNIRRIQNGTEAHISFMWNKNKESDRIKKNSD